MTWPAWREWVAMREQPIGYAIRLDGGDWQEVPVAGYIAAEREAGMSGPGHQTGEPATIAFVGFFTHGLGHDAVKIKVEGKVLL